MSILNWAEEHGFSNDDDENTGFDYVEVEIQFGHEFFYACVVEVETFRNMPCNASIYSMHRVMIDDDGYEIDQTELKKEDFPHYISKAAEKKALEML